MHARRSFYSWIALFVFAFAAHVGIANADSDRRLITGPGGVPIFDNSIPESAPTSETTLTFVGTPAPAPPPIPPVSAITLPGVSVIVLIDPASEPPEPTESPIVIPGPSGPFTIGDGVIWTLGIPAAPPR